MKKILTYGIKYELDDLYKQANNLLQAVGLNMLCNLDETKEILLNLVNDDFQDESYSSTLNSEEFEDFYDEEYSEYSYDLDVPDLSWTGQPNK